MTIKTRIIKLTRQSLAAQARKLSGDVDGARWALVELAAQAKAEGVLYWAEVIADECLREPETVEAWARTWEWCKHVYKVDWRKRLSYSFYECAAKRATALGDDVMLELLLTAETHRTKYEAFRAELSTLAGKPGYNSGEFPAFIAHERKRIADWIDRAPSQHSANCLKLAEAALRDALIMAMDIAV